MGTVLVAAGLVSGVSSLLAVLLLLAERYLVNYGTCVIDINNGSKRLDVQGGRPLLTSLMEQDIFVPSACGGRGTCAYCTLQVTDGGGPIVPIELSLLSEDERVSGVRLSCQVKVRNDISVLIPEQLLLVREYTGVVEHIRDLTHDIKEVRIRLVEPETIEFVPGQYIQLETPPYGDNPEPVYRAYSLSSPPCDNRHVETIIRLVEEGICTTWVFNNLNQGDEITFNGPYGEFRMTDTDRHMVWVAGGSGMAPFWSMLRQMQQDGVQRPCTYFFGALQSRDLFLVDEIRQIEKQLPNFTFVPALSEPAADDQWSGETGLITDVVDRRVTHVGDKEFYLCGGSGMIDAAIDTLKGKGVADDRIYYDKFT